MMSINTLKFKFIVFNFLVVVLLFFIITIITSRTYRGFVIEERKESRIMVNNQIASTAGPIIVNELGVEWKTFIFDEIFPQYTDLVYCVAIGLALEMNYLQDDNFRTYFIKNEKKAKEFEDLFKKRPNETKVYERNGVLNIISPVYGFANKDKEECLGYIISGFSLEPIVAKMGEINKIIIFTVFFIVLLVSLMAYFMTALFLKPLDSAIEVIEGVAQGDFSRTLSIKPKSEIGKLITTVNKMVSALKASEERYQNILEFADVGIIAGESGKIVEINKKAEEIYGYSKDELIGQSPTILTPEKHRKQHIELLNEFLTSEKTHSNVFEEEGIRKNGSFFPIEVSFSLTKTKENSIIAVMRDITERKKMEQKIIQSEKLKSLGELAHGVAHDFNNVLAAILGRAQLLKMNTELPLSKEGGKESVNILKKGLEVIERAAQDGAETVRRIQEFSRRKEISDTIKKYSTINLKEVIDNALEFTKVKWNNEAQAQGIEMTIHKELSHTFPMKGNESELREVFINLINNAIDAMPQGGSISIKTFDENNHISIKIKDNGSGIPETVLSRIFDPFFTTKGVHYSGLGLSVSYGIIHRHHGTITVDSIEGKGTTFTITLPIAEEIAKEKVKTVTDDQRKAKILVIEDESDVCELIKDILTDQGHEVETASNGTQGIALFKTNTFDMVFTDLGMPGITGWQVSEEIKKLDRKVPVALITGWSIQLKDCELKEKGVDFIVNKPFQMEQIQWLAQEGIILREQLLMA